MDKLEDVVFIIGVILIILKLCSVIAWSWGLVMLPFWGFAVVVLVLMATEG